MVSDEEVLSAIGYLDPDLPDESIIDRYRVALRFRRRLRASFAIASVVVVLCVIFCKILIRLLHFLT
jgi:hypothetical protein